MAPSKSLESVQSLCRTQCTHPSLSGGHSFGFGIEETVVLSNSVENCAVRDIGDKHHEGTYRGLG